MNPWPEPLKRLMAVGIGLHLLFVLLPLPGYMRIGFLAGLSGGYLATASAAYVRTKVAHPHFYAAILAIWLFWVGLLWWQQWMTLLDAVIEPFFTVVFFVGACLGISFYARWKSGQNHFQFSLIELISLMTIVAGISVVIRQYSLSASLIGMVIPCILTTITACYVLAICERESRWYGAVMFGYLILLLILQGLQGINQMFYVSVIHWPMLVGGSRMLLQIPKDEIETEAASSEATASPPPSDPTAGQPDEL
ncbi:hypothetical protein GC197_13470 [bacterium]|nr:hypothetical protein [bacterium]